MAMATGTHAAYLSATESRESMITSEGNAQGLASIDVTACSYQLRLLTARRPELGSSPAETERQIKMHCNLLQRSDREVNGRVTSRGSWPLWKAGTHLY